jgi:hypothetical protein
MAPRATMLANKELKLTKPSMIGASQLNSSVRRTVVEATRVRRQKAR